MVFLSSFSWISLLLCLLLVISFLLHSSSSLIFKVFFPWQCLHLCLISPSTWVAMILRVRFSNPRGPWGHFHWWFLLKWYSPWCFWQWILFLREVEGFVSYWWSHLSPPWEGATFHCFPDQGACPGHDDSPPFCFWGGRRSDRDVRASPCVHSSHNVGSSSSLPTITSCEWVREMFWR